MDEKEKQFLIGLEKLTRETGVAIGGCGCCGSPFLHPAMPEELVGEAGYAYVDKVEWISPYDKYDWEKNAANIVKDGE